MLFYVVLLLYGVWVVLSFYNEYGNWYISISYVLYDNSIYILKRYTICMKCIKHTTTTVRCY